MKKPIVIVSLLMSAGLIANPVYQYKTDEGRVVFTDQPPKDKQFEKVDLKTINQTQIDPDLKAKTQSYYKKINEEEQRVKDEVALQKKQQKAIKSELNRSKEALNSAKVIQAGDFYRNKSGGIRYKDEYLERVNKANNDVDRFDKPN